MSHPQLPSAPLRAFSYTQAGGASSCGVRPNAVFKCPDGYAGSYPEKLPPIGGYADFKNASGNPFSNKIVLMDEVHNLVRPSGEILRNEKRMLMLMRLRQLLRTAENSVIIGLSGTPLCDVPAEALALQNLIKGRHQQQLNDEGFISYCAQCHAAQHEAMPLSPYTSSNSSVVLLGAHPLSCAADARCTDMETPRSVFPRIHPAGLPSALPAACLRHVPLRNLPFDTVERRRRGAAGNRREYEAKLADEVRKLVDFDEEKVDLPDGGGVRSLDAIKLGSLSRLCAVAQTFSYAGREDVSRVLHGAPGKLLKREVAEVSYGSTEQVQRARGYASKLLRIVEDVAAGPPLKTLVIVHRYAGYKLLLRMLGKRLGGEVVRGFPAARTAAEKRDVAIASLLGSGHDESRGKGSCTCALCAFNRGDGGARVMVADAKECGEGVSFLGVRRLLLADVPSTAEDLMQRVGRAVRFMGHAMLPAEERNVEVRMYVSTLKAGPTAEEVLVERLRAGLGGYMPELRLLKAKAVDASMWEEEDEDEETDAELDPASGAAVEETPLSESDDELAAPTELEEPSTADRPKPKPRARARKTPAKTPKATPHPEADAAPQIELEAPADVSGDNLSADPSICPPERPRPVVTRSPGGKSDAASSPQDKENAVQKPRRSPHVSPGLASSPGLLTSSPRVDILPLNDQPTPPMCSVEPDDEQSVEPTAKPDKPSSRSGAAVSKTPRRTPVRAARPTFVKYARDAARSEDEDSGSDMDGFIVDGNEESEAESSGSSSDEWQASGESDEEESADEESSWRSGEESGSEVSPNPVSSDRASAEATLDAHEAMSKMSLNEGAAPLKTMKEKSEDSDDDILMDDEEDVAPVRSRLVKHGDA